MGDRGFYSMNDWEIRASTAESLARIADALEGRNNQRENVKPLCGHISVKSMFSDPCIRLLNHEDRHKDKTGFRWDE